MSSQSIIHSYLDWAKERLDEIDATLSSFQHDAAKLQVDVSVKAEKAMADMRAARDDFRRSVNEHANATKSTIASSKKKLEAQWTAFEGGVLAYLDATGRQAKEQEAAFRARADAQRKAWQESIDKLHKSAVSFAADRRNEIETAVTHMKAEADAAKARLDKLNKAGGKSWVAMKTALTETRNALDKANQTVHELIKRVA